MIGKYADEAAAFRAVDRQRAARGIWTGIQKQADGSYSLLYEEDYNFQDRHDQPARAPRQPITADPPPWDENDGRG